MKSIEAVRRVDRARSFGGSFSLGFKVVTLARLGGFRANEVAILPESFRGRLDRGKWFGHERALVPRTADFEAERFVMLVPAVRLQQSLEPGSHRNRLIPPHCHLHHRIGKLIEDFVEKHCARKTIQEEDFQYLRLRISPQGNCSILFTLPLIHHAGEVD